MGIVSEILGFIAQTNERDQRERLLKQKEEEWAITKEHVKATTTQQNMMLEGLKLLPPEMQSAALMNKEFGGLLMMLASINAKNLGGNTQDFETKMASQKLANYPTAEQTGEFIRPTQEMLPQMPNPAQGLSKQIAGEQLFGGLNLQDAIKDYAFKQYGFGRSTEPVKSDLKIRLPNGKYVYSQILRNGTVVPTNEEVPPEWKETQIDTQSGRFNVLRNMVNGEIDWKSANPVAQEVTRERTIGGPTGVQNIPIPKLIMPGQAAPSFPEPTKMEMRTEELPSGAQRPVPYNPYGPWVTPGQAISGQGTKTIESTGGLSKQPEMMLPIKMDDVTKWIHPKTLAHPQPGISPQRATKEGYKLVTTQAATDLENIKNMEQPVKELGVLMPKVFGPESEAKKGTWVGEKAAGWQRYFEGLLQTNVDAADYKRFADSTLSIWARGISAEKGNLNEGDVKRAKGLIGDLTSRPEIAWRSYRRLQTLIKAIKERKINGTYDDSPTPLPGEEKGSAPKTAEEYMNKWR